MHSIAMEYMSKAVRFKKSKTACDILELNWYKLIYKLRNHESLF
jgi:hypothetical protein